MESKIRWGILGTGNIAKQFATGIAAIEDAELYAVGSRSKETADKFGEKFKIPHCYGSYEDLVADKNVDAIYVATPHTSHKENTLLCIKKGKPVLCEKPCAVNAREALAMIKAARKRKVFLMEAMWTHFFPAMAKVRELIAQGAIGEIRMVRADFGFRAGIDPQGRLFNPAFAGGALLDVGVYPVALAQMVFGREPASITGSAHIGETGVDEQSAMVLKYDTGALAVLTCAVRTTTHHEADIYGTDGWIKIPHPFWQPDKIVVSRNGKEEEMSFPRLGNGYSFEAVEVGRCIREGKLESDVMPHEKTMAIMRTMDKLRKQWGLKYPVER